ncbi:MAG: hypothetical protein QW228_00905 [Candidatus Aenigmatarchaeota archaeon]
MVVQRVPKSASNYFGLFYELKGLSARIDAACRIKYPFMIIYDTKRITFFNDMGMISSERNKRLFLNESFRKAHEDIYNELKNLVDNKLSFVISVYWYKNGVYFAYYRITHNSFRFLDGDFTVDSSISKEDLDLLTRWFIHKKFESQRCQYLHEKICSLESSPCPLALWLEKNYKILLKKFKKNFRL